MWQTFGREAGLGNNGGPTQTIGLLLGSPAVDAGSNPAELINDQRGVNYFRAAGKSADIGAYELQTPPRVLLTTINGGALQRSRVTTISVSFDQVVSLPANPAGAFQLNRQSDNAVVALISAVTNGVGTTVTLTFNGSVFESGSLADGRYTLTVYSAA